MKNFPSWHPNVDDKALDRVLADFDASLMSDAKWVRLLGALNKPPGVVVECLAKLVWMDKPCAFRIAETTFDFDYYDDSVEGLIDGPTATGWHRYKEIEWIEFPSVARVAANPNNAKEGIRLVDQDLSLIRSRIVSVGNFELSDVPSGLRLHAYRRRSGDLMPD